MNAIAETLRSYTYVGHGNPTADERGLTQNRESWEPSHTFALRNINTGEVSDSGIGFVEYTSLIEYLAYENVLGNDEEAVITDLTSGHAPSFILRFP